MDNTYGRYLPKAIIGTAESLLANKQWMLAIEILINAGIRNEKILTNRVFYSLYPQLRDRQLDTKQLKEWQRIRKIIRRRLSSSNRYKTLPISAIVALLKGEWSVVIGLAIHAGIRDEKRLTDIVFHGNFPELQGHRLNLVQKNEWIRIRNTQVRKYLAFPFPPTAKTKDIECGSPSKRGIAQKNLDNPKYYLTGRYEGVVVRGGGPIFAEETKLFILSANQAGNHVECIIFSPNKNNLTSKRFELYGDYQSDGTFTLFLRADVVGDVFGKISHLSRNVYKLIFQDIRGKQEIASLTLVGTRPTFMKVSLSYFEKAFLNEKETKIFKQFEWMPLRRPNFEILRAKLQKSEKELSRLIKKYLSVRGLQDARTEIQDERYDIALKIDKYIKEEIFPENFWHESQRELVKFYVRSYLSKQKLLYGSLSGSILDWLQIIIIRTFDDQKPGILDRDKEDIFSDKLSDKFKNMKKYLDLKIRGGVKHNLHTYEFSLKAIGPPSKQLKGPISAGGFRAEMIIEKTSGEPKWEKTESFILYILGISIGLSVEYKIALSTKGKATTSYNWVPGQFPGLIGLEEVGASASVGAGKGYSIHDVMTIFGDGFYPPLEVDFSGSSDTRGTGVTLAEAGLSIGKILEPDRKLPQVDITSFNVKTDYALDYKLSKNVHFCLGNSYLNAEARQALRIICASELPAFVSSLSKLAIIGYADRKDTDSRNIELSFLRALNTLQAIEDILGSKFGIPRDKNRIAIAPVDIVEIFGKKEFFDILNYPTKKLDFANDQDQVVLGFKGERAAKEAGRSDKKQNLEDRKVEIILNSRLVLTLNGY